MVAHVLWLSAAAFVSSPIGLVTPRCGVAPSVAATAAAALPVPLGLPPLSTLLSTALRWGMRHCTHKDDMMLAMVSPGAHLLPRPPPPSLPRALAKPFEQSWRAFR